MNKLDELRLINESNILYLKRIGKSYRKNEIIKNILKDETCFFKMSKEDAYIILHDIDISNEQIDLIYKKLISYDEFFRLYKNKKLDLNDEEILIKYPIYNSEKLFKKESKNG